MISVVRLVRGLVVLCAVVAPLVPPTSAAPSGGEAAEAAVHREVRLRKLHLVRPDLIPYPIAYEVCC